MSNQVSPWIKSVTSQIQRQFEEKKNLLSFDEYLRLVAEKPRRHFRGSAQYLVDALEHFGMSESSHFYAFDGSPRMRRVIGHDEVQSELYRTLKSFARIGINHRLLLLHGPNGSAKTSILQTLAHTLERYSEHPEGAVYTYSWIFPQDRATKGAMGLGARSASDTRDFSSFAHLPEGDVAAKIPALLRDSPLMLLPPEKRREYLVQVLGEKEGSEFYASLSDHLRLGEMNPRCQEIFHALLQSYQGDYSKVLRHIQVERFEYSRKYRKGLVTIEPQLHVDAQAQLISLGKGFSGLPASLQSLNLFHISGDLIDGCRGIVEFSDLLKRPVDTFKYLLTACETGAVSVGPNILSLDTLWVGSANELQLDSFKEFPDFMSFKARMELIRVPYLLRVSEEAKVYEEDLEKISKEKPVAPHTAWVLGLWAVLTRLKRPNSINYPPALSSVISGLKPLEKAKLYDTGEVPPHLTPEEKKLLRVSLKRIREEYSSVPFYEGRMGASAREMKSVLYSAAQSSSTPHVSPLGILRELEEFCKRVSEYEFLKQDVKDGYHDAQEFIEVVRKEYLEIIDHEVRECMGLYESAQWEEYIRKYVQNISAHLKKEKIKNPLTGKLEDPDLSMMEEFEKIAGITSQDEARNGVIAQIGAWSLDHPKERVQYGVVFPEFWKALEKHYFESQKALLNKMHAALVDYGRDPSQETDPTDEGAKLARTTLDNMKSKLHYSESCAREALIFLMKTNYGS